MYATNYYKLQSLKQHLFSKYSLAQLDSLSRARLRLLAREEGSFPCVVGKEFPVNLSQHQGLLKESHQVASVLELQHQSFQ